MIFTLTQQQDFETIANDTQIPWEKFKQKTILVTGATGMIGKHILLALSRANQIHELDMQLVGSGRNTPLADSLYEATAVDFIEGDLLDLLPIPEEPKVEEVVEEPKKEKKKKKSKKEAEEESEEIEEVEEVEEDDITEEMEEKVEPVEEKNDFKRLWAYETIDFVIHCAGVIRPSDMVNFPVNTITNTVNGTQNILSFAKEKKCSGFIFLSSTDVYGEKIEGEVTELEMGYLNLSNVRNSYAASKRLAEMLTMSYGAQYDLSVFVARLPMVFDSEAAKSETSELHQFFRDVLGGGNVELDGAGKNTVNCAYITDVVRGILVVLTKATPQEVYNIGTQENACSVKAFAEIVARVMSDKRAYVVTKKKAKSRRLGEDLQYQFVVNSDRLQWLGYSVTYSLEDMVARIQKATPRQ